MSKLAQKTQLGLEDIDKSDELVSIWAKSGTKEVRQTLLIVVPCLKKKSIEQGGRRGTGSNKRGLL